MDTKTVAELIGTTPRVLRRFLRDKGSTFTAVGSNARYDFTDRDLPTIRTRFNAWQGCTSAPLPVVIIPQPDPPVCDDGDACVLEDIRDPCVRARVRRIAQEQEDRLDLMLMAAGLHITQLAA